MIFRENKEKMVQEFSSHLGKSKAAFLMSFKGMDVGQITALRKELKKEKKSEMKVFRNTLVKKALSSQKKEISESFGPHLNGSCAFVFAFEDPCETAKILSRYAKDTEHLQIRQGFMGTQALGVKDINLLATLPSQAVLRARLLSVFSAPLSRLLRVFCTLPEGALRVFSEYKDKQKKQ